MHILVHKQLLASTYKKHQKSKTNHPVTESNPVKTQKTILGTILTP
jgi:hypothetical protein